MIRKEIAPRTSWQTIVESQGLIFHSNGQYPEQGTASNWNESCYYEFTLDQIVRIEESTAELYQRCLEACDHIIKNNLLDTLGIPKFAHDAITISWQNRDPQLYGRFDLAYDGKTNPKLLEFNCDTPTALIESSIIQWFWLQDKFPNRDQFNSIHEKLIERWRAIAQLMPRDTMYFSSIADNSEEYCTVEYLRDTAQQAGLNTKFIHMEDIGNDGSAKLFDLDNKPINYWFKLYPWEWLIHEDFGLKLIESLETTGVIEPIWKMMLSNKGILPILWSLFPDHPNLLPSFFEPQEGKGWVKKPLLGREGKNMDYEDDNLKISTDGPYDGACVYQQIADLGPGPMKCTLGSWIIDDQPAGMMVREDTTPIITASSAICPHIIVD